MTPNASAASGPPRAGATATATQPSRPAPGKAATGPAHAGEAATPAPSGAVARWKPGPDAVTANVTAAGHVSAGRSTPALIRLASAAAALAGVLLAVLGAWTLQARTTALAAADLDAAQLTRLQQIDTSVVRADAAVTNAFLQGGLEPAASRQAYDQALAEATDVIAQAAAAQPADADALGALNQRLVTYVARIEQARANNRQLQPVGAGYLKLASDSLRSDVTPVLGALVATNRERLDGEFGSAARHLGTFLLVGVASLALLVVLGLWHARRFHRLASIPLAAGTLAALVAVILGTVVLAGANNKAADVRDGPLARSLAASTARINGFDAKAQESLGLINRGSGATTETGKWQPAAQRARESAVAVGAGGTGATGAELAAAWDAYATQHRAVRAADDAGDWDKARALTVATGPGSANAAFDAFATRTADVVAAGSTEAADGLDSARSPLTWTAIAVVLLGVIAAGGGVAGFGQRQREYR